MPALPKNRDENQITISDEISIRSSLPVGPQGMKKFEGKDAVAHLKQ